MANHKATVTRSKILDAAVELAGEYNYQLLTRHAVALRAGVSEGLVSHHWGTVKQLKRSVMRHAVKSGHLRIIAQGVLANDQACEKCTPEFRRAALMSTL